MLNGQSATNALSSIEYGSGSTTIPSGVQDKINQFILETAAIGDISYNFYILLDDNIRYVGITKYPIEKRFKEHLDKAKYFPKSKNRRDKWLRKCIRECKTVKTEKIFSLYVDLKTAESIENYIVDLLIDNKYNLTNGTRKNFKASPSLKNKQCLYKPVILLTKDGVYVREFESIKSAALELQVDSSHIVNILKGRKKSVKDYLILYKEDYDNKNLYSYVKYEYDKSPMKGDSPHKTYIISKIKEKNSKKIKRIDDNGNIIIYNSIADALEQLGKPRNYGSNIVKMINGSRTHAFGYKWEYV